MNLYFKEMKSPAGKLTLVASDKALVAVLWETENPGRSRFDGAARTESHPVLNQAESELREYFAGKRTKFSVPLNPSGTRFQLKVWEELRKIPFGASRSYGELAKSLGNPNACRAVGGANARNPISIIVPCHRVIGKDGGLTGFGGGLPVKKMLLELEAAAASNAA